MNLLRNSVFWENIKGVFRGESVIEYRCSGYVIDAAVATCVLFVAVYNFVISVVIGNFIFVFIDVNRSEIDSCFINFYLLMEL